MKQFRVVSIFCVSALAGAVAHGQQLGAYLSTSFDQSTGSAYAYAETTGDYSLGNYYSVCASIDALAEDDSGSQNVYYSPLDCEATDAQVSWSFTVPTTTDYVSFTGYHTEDIDYSVYQFDEYCGSDGYNCSDYWDGYAMSLLGIGGQTYDEPGASWYLPGYPVGYAEAQISELTYGERGTWCYYPDDESSSYIGLEVGLEEGRKPARASPRRWITTAVWQITQEELLASRSTAHIPTTRTEDVGSRIANMHRHSTLAVAQRGRLLEIRTPLILSVPIRPRLTITNIY